MSSVNNDTSGTSTNGTSSGTPKQAVNLGEMGDMENSFITLLVAQVQYQDPTKPVDSTEFINQYSAMAQVKSMQNMTTLQQNNLVLMDNLQTLTALDRLAETGQVVTQCSVGSLLDSLDLSALRDQLDRVAAERDINQSRLDLLAGVLAPESSHATADEDLTGILNAMEAASSTSSVSRSHRSTDLNGTLRQTESS